MLAFAMTRRLVLVSMTALLALASTAAAQNFGMSTAERWFRVEWTTESDTGGSRRVSGYVYNTYGTPAGEVQVLVEALDGGQRVVARRYEWVAGDVPPMSRSYFEARRLPSAEAYRVVVHSFRILEGAGWF
ncbi:MAG: hypothetical protein ACREJG_05530 [Candidatus Rokuibacteriota bacterium]